MHTGILLTHKKEWNNAICSKMDGLGGYNAKWNKSERKTNTVWYHLYVESKKYNKLVKINTNEADLQIQQTN